MLDVSTEWQNASKEQFRYQAYLKVSLAVVPPGLTENAIVSSDDSFVQSNPNVVLGDKSRLIRAYATLEPNRWLLNGKYKMLPNTATTDDWWSRYSVNENTAPVLTFVFDKEYTIPGIFFVWDSINKTCPTSILVKGYNLTGQQTYNVVVNNINSYTGFFDKLAMNDVKKIEVVISNWCVNKWRGRVDEVTFGLKVSFDSINNGRVVSAIQTDKSSPVSAALPTHSLDLTLRNLDGYFDPKFETGISRYLDKKQILTSQWMFMTSLNNIELAPTQTFITETFDIPNDSKNVTFKTTNRIAMLDSEFKYGNYTGTNRTLNSLVTYVLSNSNVFKEFKEQQPWVIPKEFDTIVSSAPIPVLSVNAILQLLALAGCTWLTTRSTDGFIEFKMPDESVNEFCSVGVVQELGDPGITVKDRLKSIKVGVYSYQANDSLGTIGTGSYTVVNTQSIKLRYSVNFAQEVTANVTGATLKSAKYYASYAVLILEGTKEGVETEVTLIGKEVVQQVAYIEVFNDTTISSGRDITVENPFITSIEHAKKVAEYIKPYYIKRNSYKIKYLGYPQAEAGDKIKLETVYGKSDVEITGNTITFNGAWTGDMEVV